MTRTRTAILLLVGSVAVGAPVPALVGQQTASHIVTVHYHRYDGDYDDATIWTWDERRERQPEQNEISPVGRDEFGLLFKLDAGQYGQPGGRIGLLPRLRRDWNFKDGGDRYWSSEMGNEVYVVEGRDEVYTSRPDVSPKLLAATLDVFNVITLRFTHSMQAMAPGDVTVRDQTGTAYDVARVVPVGPSPRQKSRSFAVCTAKRLEIFGNSYEVTAKGFETRRVRLGRVVASRRFYDADAQMGATCTRTATTFRVFSPMAEAVEVVVSPTQTSGPGDEAHAMAKNRHGVWSCTVGGDLSGRFYAYRLRGPGFDKEREVADPSAVCAQGRDSRTRIVDLDSTDPPGFDPTRYVKLASPTDAVIYEMSVRDFTIAATSGVKGKGKYLGLTETGTHVPGHPEIRTGLDHLVELGVSHVQLMPLQDFENDEHADAYNWGYITVFFNTPEGWYATTPDGDARIREFKGMVQALHERGIGVIMDVVYNHTSTRASFELIAPGYYFRMRPDGGFWNGSGCGNEVASENPMVRKFIVDSLAYWVSEFGVDGFRFDLMALTDLTTMKAIRDRLRQINPSVLLYGEPWAGGQSGLDSATDKEAIRGTGIAAFNDHFRDGIKGDRNDGPPGFIQSGDRIGRIRHGILGAVDDWALNPTDVLNYCVCHDNLTTWDKIVQTAPDVPDDIKRRMQRFAGLLVMTSQGIPFLPSGQELCRTKGGDHNSYTAPDSVNQIDWSLKERNHDVFAYYQGLIALRKAHPVLRLATSKEVRGRVQFLDNVPSPRCLAYTLDARGLPGETCATILVLLNGDTEEKLFRLPVMRWGVLANADRAGTEPLTVIAGSRRVPAHSGMVLWQLKTPRAQSPDS